MSVNLALFLQRLSCAPYLKRILATPKNPCFCISSGWGILAYIFERMRAFSRFAYRLTPFTFTNELTPPNGLYADCL